jgi:cell division protein FtsN
LKERTFYTVNLDTRRIVILLVIFGAVLAYSYMLGYSLGKKRGMREANPETASAEQKPNTNAKTIPKKVKPVIESEEELSQHADENLMKSEVVSLNPPKKEDEVSVLEVEETPTTKSTKPAEKQSKKKKLPPSKKLEVEETGPFYTLQLGAFSSQDQAIKFREELLSTQKVSGKLSPYIYKNGELFVVRMGRASRKKDIEKIISKLDPKLQESAIVVKQSK